MRRDRAEPVAIDYRGARDWAGIYGVVVETDSSQLPRLVHLRDHTIRIDGLSKTLDDKNARSRELYLPSRTHGSSGASSARASLISSNTRDTRLAR